MNALIQKVAAILPDLEARGTIYLFALVERKDVALWDVVLSSAWSDRDKAGAVLQMAELLTARLESREMLAVSRVVIIPSSARDVLEMPADWNGVTAGGGKVVPVSFLGLEVRQALVFKAQRPFGVPSNVLPRAAIAA